MTPSIGSKTWLGPRRTRLNCQIRDMRAVFASRPSRRRDESAPLPRPPFEDWLSTSRETSGASGRTHHRKSVLAFRGRSLRRRRRPSAALRRDAGRRCGSLAPPTLTSTENPRPIIPAALVRALLAAGAKVEVAAAEPDYGCDTVDEDDMGEFDDVAERRASTMQGKSLVACQGAVGYGQQDDAARDRIVQPHAQGPWTCHRRQFGSGPAVGAPE